jgi:hypothetical protein
MRGSKFMKKMLLLLIALITAAGSLSAAEYYLYGRVFDATGSSGTAASANSFGSLHAYRTGIPAQIGLQNPGSQIYKATGVLPAYYNSDLGDAQWTTAPAAGQTVISIIEVYNPQFAWAGDSYVAATGTGISTDDINNFETDLSDVQLHVIPTPVIISQDPAQIVIGLTGMDMDLVYGYTVYRSTTVAGVYASIGTVLQNRGNAIQYTDNTGLVYGQAYYYKFGVNFNWGGGGGAAAYYSTGAESLASSSGSIATLTNTPTASPTGSDTATCTYTQTFTCTGTDTATPTGTYTATQASTGSDTPTPTNTATSTGTATCTPTYTGTSTITDTPTITETTTDSPTGTNTPVDTETGTDTVTPTVTMTGTGTYTVTDTPTPPPTDTVTPTVTVTLTGTVMPTETMTPLVSVPTPPVAEQPIAYPQPASDTITFAYKLRAPSATVKIYVYNLMGTQVAVFGPYAGIAGINTAKIDPAQPDKGLSKFAPGIYFYIIKAPDSGSRFDVQKFEVEK